MTMFNGLTDCPNCQTEKSVGEYLSCFGCSECGYWGLSADKIIYEPEEEYPGIEHFDGQVCRKPRAA